MFRKFFNFSFFFVIIRSSMLSFRGIFMAAQFVVRWTAVDRAVCVRKVCLRFCFAMLMTAEAFRHHLETSQLPVSLRHPAAAKSLSRRLPSRIRGRNRPGARGTPETPLCIAQLRLSNSKDEPGSTHCASSRIYTNNWRSARESVSLRLFHFGRYWSTFASTSTEYVIRKRHMNPRPRDTA